MAAVWKKKHFCHTVKHPCNQCDYTATFRSNLYQHIKSRHEGKLIPCNQCNYKATHKDDLLTHINSRHEDVEFPCDKCNYKASRREYVLRHIKLSHKVPSLSIGWYKLSLKVFISHKHE